MQLSPDADTAYHTLARKIYRPEDTPFFRENPEFVELAEAALCVVKFVIERPAMLVADARDPKFAIKLLKQEMVELWKARRKKDVGEEAADVGFFGILTGLLFWEELDADDRRLVVGSMQAARSASKKKNIIWERKICEIAKGKDVQNYPSDFLGLLPYEQTANVSPRVDMITKIYRELRQKLNGTWLEARDLIETLRVEWVEAGGEGLVAGQIGLLFELAGLKLVEHQYVIDNERPDYYVENFGAREGHDG